MLPQWTNTFRAGESSKAGDRHGNSGLVLTKLSQWKRKQFPGNAEATNTLIPETVPGNATESNASKQLWQNAMKRYVALLPPDDQLSVRDTNLAQPLDSDSLNQIIAPLRNTYESGRIQRLLRSLESVANHLRSFAIVVDVAVQANPNPASLIWSGTRLLLEVCSRTMEMAESICAMLSSLAQRLSLFEQWLRLFPRAKYSELSQSTEEIYLEYIAFIVNSIKYFRRPGLQNLLRTIFWPPLKNNFDKSNIKIRALTELLVLQVQTASYQSAANRDQEMRHLLRANHASSNTTRLIFIQNASRNENFFGRANVMSEMSRLFETVTGRQVSVALHGPPGVGKSQIAIEYLYRNFDHYPVAIWLDGRDRLVLETQFIQIARQIGCIESGGNHCSEVLSWISSLDCNWLVIFDNVDDVNDIRPYWPAAARGSVIITSRDPTACEEGLANKGFAVDPFSPSDGADFILFLSATELPVDEDMKRAAFTLSEAFDGLPLGLKVAVSTMARRNYTPTQFAAALAKSVEEAEQQGIAIRKEVTSLADLFDMVLQSLHPAALALLDMVSFLNPKGIPVELFESNESSQGGSSFNFRDAAESLWMHSLLRFDNNKSSVTVHGYTQSYVYRQMRMAHSQSRHDGALCKVLVYLEQAVPELVLSPNRNPSLWERRERYLPHVWSLASRAKDPMPKDSAERLIGLMTSYGYYFYETGVYVMGHEMLEATSSLIERYGVTNARLLSELCFAKGKLYNEGNEPVLAEPHWRKALRLIEPTIQLDANCPQSDIEYLCMVYSGLGTSLTGRDRFEEAEYFHRLAVNTALRLSNQTPTRMGTLFTNLGSCLLWKGHLREAEDVLHTALLKHDRILECTLYSLANVYLRQGRVTESLAMHQEVLEIFSKQLGHSHHVTADCCVKVGTLLASKDNPERDLKQAEKFIRKGLDIYEYWCHQGMEALMRPYLARGRWILARLLEQSGVKYETEITQLKESSRSGFEEHTGKRFPDIAEDADNVVDSLVIYWSR